MNALELISFMLAPKPGRIRALNSPMDREVFTVEEARRWCVSGRAWVIDGILVFKDEFALLIIAQHRAAEADALERESFERQVDFEAAGKRHTARESHARWVSAATDRRSRMPGAPVQKSQQMRRVWPVR